MQHPTCTGIRIRSVVDAQKIFYAVQQGLLRMVTRRLDADERMQLRTGCVYAWEERGPHTELTGLGIERFTEGRRWSPSRVRDVCLYPHVSPSELTNTPLHRSSCFTMKSTLPLPTLQPRRCSPGHRVGIYRCSPMFPRHPPRDWDPLVKQTYSVWVETEKGRRKWHLSLSVQSAAESCTHICAFLHSCLFHSSNGRSTWLHR